MDCFDGNFDPTETVGDPKDEVAVSSGEVVRLFRCGALSSKEESTTGSIDANVLTETVAEAIGGVAEAIGGVVEAIGEVDDCFARRE